MRQAPNLARPGPGHRPWHRAPQLPTARRKAAWVKAGMAKSAGNPWRISMWARGVVVSVGRRCAQLPASMRDGAGPGPSVTAAKLDMAAAVLVETVGGGRESDRSRSSRGSAHLGRGARFP